jgi:glycosyltransferase involved in cell wall biosynthesis
MIRVIFISSVTPSIYKAGPIVLHRHLVDEPEIDLHVLNIEPEKWTLRKLLRRILGRLSQTGLHPFCQDVMALWRGGWIDAELPVPEETGLPTVVMTVAHEEACYAAMRYAKRYNLPLVTFFHDWWPDIPNIHLPFRHVIERSFRRLYRESALALCVSPGMKKALGPHENAKVLLPIPAKPEPTNDHSAHEISKPFRLLYAGNLTEYGPMLMAALHVFKDHPSIRLEVRGSNPAWPPSFVEKMRDCGLFLPYVPRSELGSWLDSADGFLITQTFEEKDKRLMQTNFPSKLVEFSQLGKPLIVWGPAEASSVMWARDRGHGLVVDKDDPESLKHAVQRLCDDGNEQRELAEGAKYAASDYFSAKHIQAEFMRHLNSLDYGGL